jgi:hypothetical protein
MHIADLDTAVEILDQRLIELHNANPVSQDLTEIPVIDPITTISMTLTGKPESF